MSLAKIDVMIVFVFILSVVHVVFNRSVRRMKNVSSIGRLKKKSNVKISCSRGFVLPLSVLISGTGSLSLTRRVHVPGTGYLYWI
jgi:hypothetical protein